MTPELWEQIGELYHAALELEPARRAAFLAEACGNDGQLRGEVESLLAAAESAGTFIVQPALKDAAKMLAEEKITSLDAPSAAPADSLTEGRELGRYRIGSLLGKGGMGEVYLAYDVRLERRVALKLLPAQFTGDPVRVRRFIKEARAVSALNHPNILTIHEIGEAEACYYLVTEFIEGRTLRRLMAQGDLPLPASLDIAEQIAGALAAAHAAGIVHRDIKPENVMVRPDGLVKVLDFGLAKLMERPARQSEFETAGTPSGKFKTDPGVILGTTAYMSPEQLRGQEVDARSDLFSLGVLCYEMIAGQRPFEGETSSHVIVAILDQEPAPLSRHREVSAELQAVIRKALAKDREKRHQRAEQLLAELKSLRRGPQTAPATPSAESIAQPKDESPISPGLFQPTVEEAKAVVVKESEPLPRRWALNRRGAVFALVAVAVAAVLFRFGGFHRAPALTEPDTVLLADFENKTGDEVFDGTLKQALAVQLEQTPFLDVFPEDRARETLRYMDRPAETRLTREVAREICRRNGLKALLAGSIVQLDRRYSLILEAINSESGAVTAGVMVEAESKDQVLRALAQAATQLRQRLGESLASIQKFAAPPEQATTRSLEAFRAWARGVELGRAGKRLEAIPFYKLAKQLDPNFARADVSLSLAYGTGGEMELAAEHAANAYALRDRVTERERFDIVGTYHALYTGDLFQAIEMYELLARTYPRDYAPRARLASVYRFIGEVEKSLAVAREALQLNPKAYLPQVRTGAALMQLKRPEEARAMLEQTIKQFPDSPARGDLYQLAALTGDAGLMKRQIEWTLGKSEEHWAFYWQAQSAAFAGRLRQARELYARAAAQAESRFPERAALFAAESLLADAVCGVCERMKNRDAIAGADARVPLQLEVPAAVSRALAPALCGETERAQSLAAEVRKRNPQSTLANLIWLPVLAAAVELRRGRPELALQSLQKTAPYERAALFWPNYLRGLAYLRLRQGREAAAEFQKILDHRGWDALSPLFPPAHLELARAAALTGDDAGRRSHQAFLELWKDADADIPILQAARRENENLSTK